MSAESTVSHSPAFGSAYLEHLSMLKNEAQARYRGVPPFKAMLVIAILLHSLLVIPAIFFDNQIVIPSTKQVRLAFGEDSTNEDAASGGIGQIDGSGQIQKQPDTQEQNKAVNNMDAILAPPSLPQRRVAPAAPVSNSVAESQEASEVEQVVTSANAKRNPPVERRYRTESQPRRPSGAVGINGMGGAGGAGGYGQGKNMTAGEVQEIVSRYEQLLSGWINSHRANQEFSLHKGLKGRVVVRVRINRSGYIAWQTVEQSSGYEELDKAALEAVTRASPVPAVPEEYPGGAQLEFLVPINIIVK